MQTPRLLLLIVIATSVACGRPLLTNAQPSAEDLGREVLAAAARKDLQRLADLALSEEEFKQRVWPDLPAARPERNVPVDYVWGDLRQKSAQMLQRSLARYGSTPFELQAVSFVGDTTDHGHYRVHRDAILRVTTPSGERRDLRVLGAMIEADGVWKVFSYAVND